MIAIHGLAAGTPYLAILTGERLSTEQQGRIVVSQNFLFALKTAELAHVYRGIARQDAVNPSVYRSEARSISTFQGGSQEEIARRLRETFESRGTTEFVTKRVAQPGLRFFVLKRWNGSPAMLGSLVLIWWALMMAFQGEGLELDLQRRRHPMWEWLFSPPVPIGAVFLAEMLAPLAANPIYWTAPVFVGAAFGLAYGFKLGVLAALLAGIPLSVASGCLGKALEVGVTLRVAPRQRGAIVGLMSWMGYASMMLLFLGTFVAPKISTLALKWLSPLAALPWPWLGLFLGATPDGHFSFMAGLLTCCAVACLVIAVSVSLSIWATQQGLAGAFGATDRAPAASGKSLRLGKEPLYRKELLWFLRDRSAIVQSILIPLTVSGVQLFNLRGVIRLAQGEWNYLSGGAIIFGTYFLWILGPKSLASEGSALWIALTWPRGLESLLKAKAWLWSMLSNGLVATVLTYAVVMFPHEWWKVVLVAVAWAFFGRSMAEKSVTLVTITSESGEVQKLRGGNTRWRPTRHAHIRDWRVDPAMEHRCNGNCVFLHHGGCHVAELPSQTSLSLRPLVGGAPGSPTLVHAMVAISAMVELGAVLTGIFIAAMGRGSAPLAQAASYALSAIVVWFGTIRFLDNRGVSMSDVWVWRDIVRRPVPRFTSSLSIVQNSSIASSDDTPEDIPWWKAFGPLDGKFFVLLLIGASLGIALGLIEMGYMEMLRHLPTIGEIIRKSQEALKGHPDWRIAQAIMAVAFAPFAEEYLFRGLLYRALDREWGGWKAVVGSAAFFCFYHPPLAWPLVFSLGAINAIMFKKTRRLAPAVVLHMTYNAVVLFR